MTKELMRTCADLIVILIDAYTHTVLLTVKYTKSTNRTQLQTRSWMKHKHNFKISML